MRQGNNMRVFQNKGCGRCVLLEQDSASSMMLIAAVDRGEYVVACGPLADDGSWNWALYYNSIDEAVEDYREKTK